MKKFLMIGLGVLLLLFLYEQDDLNPYVYLFPKVGLTLHIVDEDGDPLPNAMGRLSFSIATWNGKPFVKIIESKPDKNGYLTGWGRTDGEVGYGAQLPGYYSFNRNRYPFVGTGSGWTPNNPVVDVLLRKIVNPIPMYAKGLKVEIPVTDKPVGFDLMAGDWVVPHGNGKVSDFVFQLRRRYISRDDFDATLQTSFSNKGDGLHPYSAPPFSDGGSELHIPRVAPLDGYNPTLSPTLGCAANTPIKDSTMSNQNYYFRVRTVLDPRGKVVSALYGKIYDDIRFDPINSKTAVILMNYYLNPTPNDPNVEFDLKRNLFGELPSLKQVPVP